MKNKVSQVLIYVLGSLLFLSIPFFFGPEGIHGFSDLTYDRNFLREFMSFSFLVVYFYLNYFILIPRLLVEKKYLIYFGLLLIIYLVIVFFPMFMVPFSDMGLQDIQKFDGGHRPPHPHGKRMIFPIMNNLFIFLAVSFFSIMLKINNRLKQTEKEKLSSELLYLRSQINPHFLFNTLNSIYSLAIQKSDLTATAVVKLSGMMRYVISETERNFVSLEKEINYITDFIELQKIRLDEVIVVQYEVNGDVTGKKIAPLILIPFIENAFKFGINPELDSEIIVKIDIGEDNLILKVKNNKVYQPDDKAKQSGVGIENTKTRLKLLYPGKYKLIFRETDRDFHITLTLNLK
jgi:hypothetical protein